MFIQKQQNTWKTNICYKTNKRKRAENHDFNAKMQKLQLLHHLEASKYQGKSFQKWAVDYFDLDEELINSYKDDPYLACNVVQDGWEKYIEMQK